MTPRARRKYAMLPRKHPTAMAFLDESGAIAKDRYFCVGMLKSNEPSRLLRAVNKFRDQKHWYKEIKFSEATRDSVPLYTELVDVILANGDPEFFCFVADRKVADPVARFGDTWSAYQKVAEQLIVAAIRPPELVTVLADNYSTPDTVLFEEELTASVNRRLRRLALTNVVRVDSRSSDALQAADPLVSSVAFEFRASAGLASVTSPKARLAAHTRQALGCSTTLQPPERDKISILGEGHWPLAHL